MSLKGCTGKERRGEERFQVKARGEAKVDAEIRGHRVLFFGVMGALVFRGHFLWSARCSRPKCLAAPKPGHRPPGLRVVLQHHVPA
ncbi:hypothetical protein GCM10010449_10470 [Streptomyces rectiviolaceus]|uniref:Uncharacterized protein n=1 Tax=Streptomyces rectiviolaceus TaxID=332591 RepID=A0ABP6MBN6_9ACTN